MTPTMRARCGRAVEPVSSPSAADKEAAALLAASNPPEKPGLRAAPTNASRRPFTSDAPLARVCRFLLGLLAMARTASAMVIPDKAALSTALGEFCAGAYTSSEITAWDVSAVTDMGQLINNAPCKSTFNSDLNAWDVGKVTTTQVRLLASEGLPPPTAQPGHVPQTECMCRGAAQGMFEQAAAYNQPMNAWDVGKVTNTWVRLGLGGAAPTRRTARAHAPD